MEYNKKYGFGGLVFEINSPIPLLDKEQLSAFEIEGEADIVCNILSDSTGDPVVDGKTVSVPMGDKDISKITVANLFGLCNIGAMLPRLGRFILHCSYIMQNGEAILFTAPSGTGKSTIARHFRDNLGAQIINEDRAIISRENGKYYASGCWAMGSADTCLNVTAPIRAVVILSQGNENKVSVPGGGEVISKIVPQCTFDEKSIVGRLTIIDEVSKLSEGARIVSYSCINDPSAAYELEMSI